MNLLKYIKINNLLQVCFFSFIFLWDIKYEIYQFRLLIIIPFLFILFNYKNKIYNLFLTYSLVPILILLHFFLVNIHSGINLEQRDIFGILLLFIIFNVSLFYKDHIFNHLDKYINWFIILFSISFMLFFMSTDTKLILNCYNGWFHQTKFIFIENSHFALISVPIINYYSLFFCKLKNFNRNDKILFFFFVIFLIISFINFSTTFLVGLILMNLYLLFFYRKNLKIKILSIFFILLSFFIILNKSECAERSIVPIKTLPEYLIKFVPESIGSRIEKIIPKHLELTEKLDVKWDKLKEGWYDKQGKQRYIDKNATMELLSKQITKAKATGDWTSFDVMVDKKKKVTLSQSVETLLVSLKITIKSIKNNPFGVGFNRYHVSHKKYIKDINLVDPGIKKFNIFDGSSNISKFITEFGVFGIIFILAFLYTALKFKDFESKKFFLISIISLQFLRGVGYFNGGFLLLAIIYFCNYLKIREENKQI